MIVFVKHIVRIVILIFWATIIYSFLLLPYLEKFFVQENKYLCVYTWADRIDESVLKGFEKKTGIKVYIDHYESNEELLTKLEKMPYVDCDIILPSGYIVQALAQSQLIKPFEHHRCDFISRIYPSFLQSHDVRDTYSVPLYWDVLGIGYNNKKIDVDNASLKMVFDRDEYKDKKIGMIDDSRQSIFLTALYLGYSLDSFSRDQLRELRLLLNKQKQWVGAYSDAQQGYYLASGTFNMVVSEREYICKEMQKHDFISFALPTEGSLLTVDRVVVSSSTKKDEWVYQFINYLFSYEVLKQHCEKFCLLPSCKDVYESLDQKYIGIKNFSPETPLFKTLKSFKNILTHKQINDFWVKLKAA